MKGFLQCNMMGRDIDTAILSPLEDEEDLLPELRCGRIVTLVKENNPADGCIRSGGDSVTRKNPLSLDKGKGI
jgi:hypothetical protein